MQADSCTRGMVGTYIQLQLEYSVVTVGAVKRASVTALPRGGVPRSHGRLWTQGVVVLYVGRQRRKSAGG